MLFTQTTLALALAATVAALPTQGGGGGSGGSPPPAGPSCDSGSNYCFQNGKLTEGQTQSCSTGDSYCCSSSGSGQGEERVRRGLLGDNSLNCVSALNGAQISLPISALSKRNEGQDHPQGPPPASCSSGSNYCYQSGKATWDQTQTCSTGDSYCCSASGEDPTANCLNLLNGAQVAVPVTVLGGGILRMARRNEGQGQGHPQGPPPPSCSSGSNYCAQNGKFTEGQEQDCSTGSSYCCSSNGGTLNCVNALNGLTLEVPITIG